MKLSCASSLLSPVLALLLSGLAGWSAPLAWSKRYTIQSPAQAEMLFGTIYAQPPGGSGFVFVGASQENASGESRLLPSLARFDDSGNRLWSVELDGGTGSSDPRLNAPDDSARLQAGYTTDNDTVRVGAYQGATLAKRFAVELPVFEPDFDEVIVDRGPRFFDDGRTALVELGDASVKVTLLDDAGGKVIDRVYRSTAFAVDLDGFIPPTGSISFEPLADGSGYLLAVSISVAEFIPVPPFSFSYDNVISLICLNNSGTVRWARSVTMNDTEGEISASAWPGPAGQTILLLSETTSAIGLSEGTHVLRFASDGTLTWARTLADSALDLVRFEGGNPWVFGSTGDRADMRILRFTDANGSLAAQARLGSPVFDIGTSVGLVNGRILIAMQSVVSTASDRMRHALAVSLDSNLQNPVVRRYHKTVGNLVMSYHATSGSVIFSPFDPTNGTVEVVSMLPMLQPVTDCSLFSNTTISLTNSGASNVVLSVTAPALSVTTANAGTTVTPAEISLRAVDLATTSLCTDNGTPTAPQISITSASGGGFEIRFASENGVNYEVRFSPVVNGPFNTILATLAGTGASLTYNIGPATTSSGYYVVRAVRQ